MTQPSRWQQAKTAAGEWKYQFFQRFSPRLAQQETGQRRNNPYMLLSSEEQAPRPPKPEKLGDVVRLGAGLGFLGGAGLVIFAVATHGTATPLAVATGGLLFSTISAIAAASVAPLAAVILGAPIAALAGALGRKAPSFPSIPLPDLKIPVPDGEELRQKAEEFRQDAKVRLSHLFQRAASSAKISKPAHQPPANKPEPPHTP